MIEVRVPPSKSVTQRALILAALGGVPCRVIDPLDCDDSRAMAHGLGQLGGRVERGDAEWRVVPLRVPIDVADCSLHLGNAGTAVRFTTGLAALLCGSYTVDGDEAMRGRPMPGLLAALGGLGVGVRELGRPGCPPVRLTGTATGSGEGSGPAHARIEAGGSSQELSALLLTGCRIPGGLEVAVDGQMPSMPYVELTLAVMRAFGVAVERRTPTAFLVPEVLPSLAEYAVEPDWSSASYPLAASWLTGRPVRVPGVREDSVQGDRVFRTILADIGRPGPREIDLADAPDLAPTVIACALFAEGETAITGAAHLRIKESDRIGVPVRELAKLGADLEQRPDGLIVRPTPLRGPAALDPARDHRLAMAFGLVSLRVEGVRILDPDCVSKSYPDYWSMLEKFR